MSEQDSLWKLWPLFVTTLVLSLLFAWIFMISLDRAAAARSTELSLQNDNPGTVTAKGLEMTPTLVWPPETTAVPVKPKQPAPWWPALLFGLAFVSGWVVRHALKDSASIDAAVGDAKRDPRSAQQTEPVDDGRNEGRPTERSPKRASVLNVTSVRPVDSPDLSTDFPWDESVASGLSGLDNEERMAQLEKLNASKAEIIKALEKLVVENREKWLHQDETEARLNRHIEELSRDLQVAVRQLQELQSDIPSRSSRPRKKTG